MMKNQLKKPMQYIIYARKSSEGEDRQIQSIDDQINFAKKRAKEKGLKIVEIFSESKSAKDPGRPVFEEMISFIEEGEASGILCWKIDRLSRNPIDSGKIQWLLQKGVIKEIVTSERIYLPEDDSLISSIIMGSSTQYSRNLSKDVKRGIRSKLEKGIWPSSAPVGYLNKESKIITDKSKTKYIKKAFLLYSKGNYSLKEITNLLFEEGFRSKGGGRYYKSSIYKILSNTFYYGLMLNKDNYYQGTHEPIISKEIFDKVQLVLRGKSHARRKKHFFTYRELLHCEECGCLLTATTKKGYNYYYCTNGKGNCEEHKKYLREELVEKILANSLDKLKMKPEMIEIFYQSAKEKIDLTKSYKEDVQKTLLNKLKRVTLKQERLLEGYCSEIISKDSYKQKEQLLQKEEAELKLQIKKIKKKTVRDDVTLEQTKKLFLKACYAKKEFLQAKNKRKTKTLQNLLWNATVQNRELATVSFEREFQLIANEPNKDDFEKMRRREDSNPWSA